MHPGILAVDEEIAAEVVERLGDWIRRPDYPCVGAKSVLARDTLKIIVAKDLSSGWDDLRIHDGLLDWADRYRSEPGGLRSFVVAFENPRVLSELDFETFLWERLQSLADKDVWLGQRHDPSVSADPDDPHFSLSFGGQAFFVVGLHPGASRPARRFAYPTLVFNLHDQFERLRAEGRYDGMRAKILSRDEKLAGSINPMLARHGEASEARQYSGRAVDAQWRCPFNRTDA